MSSHHRILFLSLLLCFSFATVAEAEQHLCPSPESILKTTTRSLMKFSNEYGYDVWSVHYSSNFNTNEKWEINYSVFETPSADKAWDIFQSAFAKVRNPPQYASNDLLAWRCDYKFSTNKAPIGGEVLLKPNHAQSPICPSPADIKQRLNNKNLMSYNYLERQFNGGGGYYYGTMEISDYYNTNKQWILSFRVESVSSHDDAWNSYLSFMDLLSSDRKAVDYGTFWQCNYDLGSKYGGFSGYNGKQFQVFAVSKDQ